MKFLHHFMKHFMKLIISGRICWATLTLWHFWDLVNSWGTHLHCMETFLPQIISEISISSAFKQIWYDAEMIKCFLRISFSHPLSSSCEPISVFLSHLLNSTPLDKQLPFWNSLLSLPLDSKWPLLLLSIEWLFRNFIHWEAIFHLGKFLQ